MNKEQLKEIKAEPIVETHSMYDPPKYITKDIHMISANYSYLRCYSIIHSEINTKSIQDKQNQSNCDSESDIKKLVLHKK